MRPTLIRRITSLKRYDAQPIDCENDTCLLLKGELINPNPLVWHIKTDKEELYLPKMIFNVEPTKDGLLIYHINLLTLGQDHPITQRVMNELYRFYAQGESIENLYRKLGIPHQTITPLFQRYFFLSKRYYMKDKLDEASFEEILQAYQNHKLIDLAVKYRTTVQKLLKKLLIELAHRRKTCKAQARMYKTYALAPNKNKNQIYIYKTDKQRANKIRYVGKINQNVQEMVSKWQQIRASFLAKLQEYDALIRQVKDDLKKQIEGGRTINSPANAPTQL